MKRKHAFDGVKVVNFGWMVVAPLTARELAWHLSLIHILTLPTNREV